MRRPLLESPRIGAQGGKIGAPRKVAPAYDSWPIREEPPPNIQEFIRERAAAGDTLFLIAHALGTNDEMLRRWMRDDQNLAWAYKVGCAQDEQEWVKILKRDALDAERPNLNALAYLNRRHQWRRDDSEGARVNVAIINLPAERPLSDFIEINNGNGTQTHLISTTRS